MFERPWNLAAYGTSLLLLVVGTLAGTNWTVPVAIATFAAWDAAYLRSASSMQGRTIDVALQQTQNIREHLSYFLAFYGVIFAILFTQPSERQARFVEISREAGIAPWLFAVPFLLVLLPLLFFPIQLARSGGNEPSDALKALVALSAFLQKVSIFLLAHIVLRILHEMTRAVG